MGEDSSLNNTHVASKSERSLNPYVPVQNHMKIYSSSRGVGHYES